MTENNEEWDYCTIKFQLRHKGEDMTRAGMQQVWLVFQASVSGHHQNYLAGESLQIPVPANVIGASYLPQKNAGSHVSVHQNLLNELHAQGWKLLPDKSSLWWERRLRRAALPKKSPFGWLRRQKSAKSRP